MTLQIDLLTLVMRWMHILAAITAVGGTIFMRFALVPAALELDEPTRLKLQEAIRRRWAKWVMGAIAFLLISGFTNFFTFLPVLKSWKAPWYGAYSMLFGMKFMLAVGIFFIASVVSGRSKGTEKFRQNLKFWLSVNIVLAVLLVMISGVMRAQHTGMNVPVPVVASPEQK